MRHNVGLFMNVEAQFTQAEMLSTWNAAYRELIR